MVFLLYAIDNTLSEHDKLLLYDNIQELMEKYVVDHCYGRGAGGEWEKICDIMNLQLLTPQENTEKGSQRYDKRHENFKRMVRRFLNR